MSNIGGNAIAKAILNTAQKVSKDNIRFPVIGTMDGSLNLKIDGFSRAIPRSDYYILQPRINLYTRSVPTTDDGSYSTLSDDFKLELWLKPGDRVLCIPIEDGHTFVIVGHVQGGLVP